MADLYTKGLNFDKRKTYQQVERVTEQVHRFAWGYRVRRWMCGREWRDVNWDGVSAKVRQWALVSWRRHEGVGERQWAQGAVG